MDARHKAGRDDAWAYLMTTRQRASQTSLFAAAGLDRDAPRPLADKLRPQELADVVGQGHLLGPDGGAVHDFPPEMIFTSGRRAQTETLAPFFGGRVPA